MGIPVLSLFPAIDAALKTPDGRAAAAADGLIPRAVAAVKQRFPELGVLTDVALDPYTSHGQDGVIDADGYILNDETVAQLVKQALAHAAAGVDIEAGDRAVELMKGAVKATHTANVVGGVGGFAGLFDATELLKYRKPYLATSTDGVGTKVAIAQAMDIHDTIGQDLVGMVVDDIVVCGAEPLFMTDYIACGKVVPERIADIVRGAACSCGT